MSDGRIHSIALQAADALESAAGGVAMEDVSELVFHAGLGLIEWSEFVENIVSIFPGSFCTINSQNRRNHNVGFASFAGMSSQSADAYIGHYAALNPWNRYWAELKPGKIMRSEEYCPASMFEKTEFINDWLNPIQRNSMGIGIKLNATSDDDVYMAMHVHGAGKYTVERDIARMLRTQAGNIARAAEINLILSESVTKSVSAAAIVQRGGDIAIVVDQSLRILEANDLAEAVFVQGKLAANRENRLILTDEGAMKWVGNTVSALLSGSPVAHNKYYMNDQKGSYQILVTKVLAEDPRKGGQFLMQKRLALVLIRDLIAQRTDEAGQRAFLLNAGLTPAEINLCLLLSTGVPLAEASDRLRTSRETGRQRLKAIFQKLDLHRQSELVLLLSRLA